MKRLQKLASMDLEEALHHYQGAEWRKLSRRQRMKDLWMQI